MSIDKRKVISEQDIKSTLIKSSDLQNRNHGEKDRRIYTNYNPDQGHIKCFAINCNNMGTTKLKVKFVEKFGCFCNSCATEMSQLGLVYTWQNED